MTVGVFRKFRTTTLEEFREELLSTGGYVSPPERSAPSRARTSALTTLRFSLSVSRVFPMCALIRPFGLLTVDKWAHICFSCVQCAESLGMKVILEGWKARQSYDGPVIYVANHMSMYETILLPPVLLSFGKLNIVAKASLAHLPFLEKAAFEMGILPIGRKNPKEDLVNMFKNGVERTQGGNSILLFPQGTRQEVFSRKRFSSIGAKLAERAGCPVVPIAIDTRCQPTRDKGVFRKVFHDFGPVDTSRDIRCACGPVIPCGKSRQMQDESFEWIADKLESWGIGVER